MQKRKKLLTPGAIIAMGFGGTILLGTLLLMLPFASRSGNITCFSDALFTATSATCVTGLVVQDTFQYWSGFGQFIILLLIQIGGMGVITMSIAVFALTGRKIGLRSRFIMQESISAPQMGGIIRFTGFIVKGTLIFEGIGALLLALRLCPRYGLGQGLWMSVFHSISAFCNAGFDLMGHSGKFSSLTAFTFDPVVNIVIILLIVIGGIGFLVWEDVYTHKLRIKLYRLQSKIVLTTTLCLLLFPFIYYFFAEFSRSQWNFTNIGQQLLAALFQTVTARTAGFNTVDLQLMTGTSLTLMIVLMLIGGSSGSTAGGLKTTTFAVLFLSVKSVFKKEEHIQCFGRRLPPETLRYAAALFCMYITLCLVSAGIISSVENVGMMTAIFETGSAVATVGLSLGLTPSLCQFSRMILILLMFFGRVGGLTLIFAMNGQFAPSAGLMPQEKITVG